MGVNLHRLTGANKLTSCAKGRENCMSNGAAECRVECMSAGVRSLELNGQAAPVDGGRRGKEARVIVVCSV